MDDGMPDNPGWKKDGSVGFHQSVGTYPDTEIGSVRFAASFGGDLYAWVGGVKYMLSRDDALALLIHTVKAE